MLVSPAKAVSIYIVSKPTLYADMKSGKLSFTKDQRGKRKIDHAELERVYTKRQGSDGQLTNSNVKDRSERKASDNIQPQTDLEKKLLEQKIDFLESQLKSKDEMIDRWQDAFDKAQKTADKITALLEDKSTLDKNTAYKDKIEALEGTINKLMEREEARQKRIEARQKRAEQKENEIQDNEPALTKEGRGLWKKMFG